MKNFDLSLFLGCCVISIGIIIAGNIIGNNLPPVISGSFSGTIMGSEQQQYGDYFSEYEACSFLRMNDETIRQLAESGELEGTYTTIQGNRLFSKERLSLWIEDRIENE